MNPRGVLVFLVLGFVGLLLVLGAVSFVRWLKAAHPRHFRAILSVLGLLLLGLGILGYLEARDRPTFRSGDLITLGEPVVGRAIATERNSPTTSCIVEIRGHLAIVDVGSGTLTVRVESNASSGSGFCPVGAEVQLDPAWLHRYTLTHRQS